MSQRKNDCRFRISTNFCIREDTCIYRFEKGITCLASSYSGFLYNRGDGINVVMEK